jgi:hypothetical protein
VGYKVRRDWLDRWLKDPKVYLPRSRMPNFRLEADEVEALSVFLLSQHAVAPLDASGVDWTRPIRTGKGPLRRGALRVDAAGRGRGGTLGPELSRGARSVGNGCSAS